MAEIYGSHFEYGGVSSWLYGLIFANVSTDRDTRVSGSVKGVTIFSNREKRRYLVGDDYSESPVPYEVEITTEDGEPIDISQIRKIEKWLFNRRQYKKLYLATEDDISASTYDYIDGEMKRFYLNCRFVDGERILRGSDIIGYKATLETDSGWWWQDAVTYTYATNLTDSDSETTITVDADYDIDDYIYPKVRVTVGETGGDVTIINETDDETRETKFVNVDPGKVFTINGAINYVSQYMYGNMYRSNFPRLLDGHNTFSVKGNVTSIAFEFNNRRML